MVKFIEHQIADRRVVRLIQKWLTAGVLEDGQIKASEVGSPQGASFSPLAANICLHYVVDLWAHRWRQQHCRGDVRIVRYVDDIIVAFEHRPEAEQFLAPLRLRLTAFGLELHPTKTRLLEFGRFARERRQEHGLGKPATSIFWALPTCVGSPGREGFPGRTAHHGDAGASQAGGSQSPAAGSANMKPSQSREPGSAPCCWAITTTTAYR